MSMLKSVIKFLIVGGISFLIYFFGYAILTRFVFPDAPLVLMSVVAVTISALFNFFAHRDWTYRAQEKRLSQPVKYVFVVLTNTALNTFLFWFGVSVLKWFDLYVAVFAAGLCAIYTFFAHRFFTFRTKNVV